jgi:hypothetical protein
MRSDRLDAEFALFSCSGFQARNAQMIRPMMKKAEGGSSSMPLGTYQPPLLTVSRIVTPNRLPEPNSSRITPTSIRIRP